MSSTVIQRIFGRSAARKEPAKAGAAMAAGVIKNLRRSSFACPADSWVMGSDNCSAR